MSYDAQEHWEIRELIARYASLLLDGRDAATMYPQVADHLKRCLACRALLADVMQPAIEEAGTTLSAADLTFLHTGRAQPRVTVTPGSSRQAFRVRIDMSSAGPPPLAGMRARSEAEAIAVLPQGGRLLCAEPFTLGKDEMIVMLTLEDGDGVKARTVAGTVQSDPPLARVLARLRVGTHSYFCDALDGTLRFQNVDLTDDPDVSLILESPA